MRVLLIVLVTYLVSTSLSATAQNQKVISDCTVEYTLSVDDTNPTPDLANSIKGATKIVYIKGNHSRSDLISSTYTLTVLHDANSDTTIVLKEIGTTKYLSYITEAKKKERNKRFEGIMFTPSSETKTILGYDCKKVVAKLKDGSGFNVYYAPAIIPSNKEYEYQFRDLDGFVLEYETQSEDGKNKIKYSANKIILTPVPASKFDIPKSGYRVL